MKEYNKNVLKIVLDDDREENDLLFLQEIEEAANDARLSNTKESDEKIRSVLNSMHKADKKKKSKRILLRVASVFLALLVGFSAITLSVKGFREKLWEFLSNINNPSYSSLLTSNNKNNQMLAEYEGMYIPKYIPEGYEVVDISNEPNYKTIDFKKSSGKTISFIEYAKNSEQKINLNKEEYESYETQYINGLETIVATKSDSVDLVINASDAIIFVMLNDDEIDILTFAGMIEKK